jgi:hypothetical protein
MQHHAKLVCSVVVLFLMALTTTVGAAPVPGEGVEGLLDLLRTKNVISADEDVALRGKPGSASAIDVKAVIELLQSKGTISKEEAEKMQQHFAVQTAQELAPPVVPATLADGVIADSVTLLPEKEIKPVIEVLREQGVLGTDWQKVERLG